MTRYFRLGYIVPRVLGIIVLYILLEWGADVALRHTVVHNGQTAAGAKVDLGGASLSLTHSQATLRDLQIANAQKPMENLLSADLVQLDLGSDALLRQRFVVEQGAIRGLRFNTPRDTSGLLESETPADKSSSSLGLFSSAPGAAKKWTAGLEQRLGADVRENYASVRLAEELAESWPARYEEARAEALALEEEASRLKEEFNNAKKNPLRNAQTLAEMPARIAALQKRLSEFSRQIESLPAEFADDRERLEEARAYDEVLIRDRLSTNQLDPDSLTNVLLGESIVAPVEQLISWVRWARKMIPAKQEEPSHATPRARGMDILFAGVTPKPKMVVKSLFLEGVTSLAGRPVEFGGVLQNLSSDPHLLEEPLTVTLKSQAGAPMIARATFDRTSDRPTDSLTFECQQLALPRLDLEAGKHVRLTVAPTTAKLEANLRVEGNRLGGVLQLVQSNVSLAAQADPSASMIEQQLAKAVSTSLARTPRAATRVTLSGSLERPGVAVSSTLGQSLAQALSGQAEALLASERDRLVGGLRESINGHLAGLDQLVAAERGAISDQLSGPLKEVQQLATGAAGSAAGSFFERVGKQLPSSGLFR